MTAAEQATAWRLGGGARVSLSSASLLDSQPRLLHFRVHAPAQLMSADAAARQVLGQFAVYDPEATLILDRDNVVWTLRAIELSINAVALSRVDFGVCELSSRNVNQSQRITHYEGRHDVRTTRALGF